MQYNKLPTGAHREDKTQKGKPTLLPHCALLRVARHMQSVNKPMGKHEARDWEKGIPIEEFLDSALRHLFQYLDGQADEDHLCAAASNILMAMWTEEKHPELQNIPSRVQDGTFLASEHIGNYVRAGQPSECKEKQRQRQGEHMLSDDTHKCHECGHIGDDVHMDNDAGYQQLCARCRKEPEYLSRAQEGTSLTSEHIDTGVSPTQPEERKEEHGKGFPECMHCGNAGINEMCDMCAEAEPTPTRYRVGEKHKGWCNKCTAGIADKTGDRCNPCMFDNPDCPTAYYPSSGKPKYGLCDTCQHQHSKGKESKCRSCSETDEQPSHYQTIF